MAAYLCEMTMACCSFESTAWALETNNPTACTARIITLKRAKDVVEHIGDTYTIGIFLYH